MSGTPTLSELTPEQALKHLELLFTRRPDGLLQGDHPGLVPGPGTEVSETRPYVIGDDVRRMDWNATARTTVPHVRLTLADRELTTWIVLDASASMDFGTARMEKRDLAVGAAAAVAFLTERAGNRLGAQITGPGGIQRIPPRTGRHHLLTILRAALDRPRVAAAAARRPRTPWPAPCARCAHSPAAAWSQSSPTSWRQAGSNPFERSPTATRSWPSRPSTLVNWSYLTWGCSTSSIQRPASGAKSPPTHGGCVSGTPKRPWNSVR